MNYYNIDFTSLKQLINFIQEHSIAEHIHINLFSMNVYSTTESINNLMEKVLDESSPAYLDLQRWLSNIKKELRKDGNKEKNVS
jgi:hypothetical protein